MTAEILSPGGDGTAFSGGLKLRPPQTADAAFMERLFSSTRGDLHALPVPRQQIELLLAQQYRLQQASYARQWPGARTFIIEHSGSPIGKITFDEAETALHIVDFIVGAEMRGQGYGTAVLRMLQAAAGKRRVTLSVDLRNLPAKKLYARLGFRPGTASATHEIMSWAAAA